MSDWHVKKSTSLFAGTIQAATLDFTRLVASYVVCPTGAIVDFYFIRPTDRAIKIQNCFGDWH